MKFYVHVAAGSGSKPGSLIPTNARRADYVTLPNGDAIGVLEHPISDCRQKLEAMPGVTVFPASISSRPLSKEEASKMAHAGVVAGDTIEAAGSKLRAHHQLPWFDVEFYETSP